jgi:hypothetical protein
MFVFQNSFQQFTYTGTVFVIYFWLHYTQRVSRGGSQRSVCRCSSFTVSRGPRILVEVYLKKVQ